MHTRLIIISFLILMGGFFGYYFFAANQLPSEEQKTKVTSFEDCARTGAEITATFPPECTYNGVTYRQMVEEADTDSVSSSVEVQNNDTDSSANTSGTQTTGGQNNNTVPPPTGILPFKSGVHGYVTLGPVCPVVTNPPDPNCADKPYETTVQVIAKGSPQSSPFAQEQTDKTGYFAFKLPPGDYFIQALGKNPLPRCESLDITIGPDEDLSITLGCDSGIR